APARYRRGAHHRHRRPGPPGRRRHPRPCHRRGGPRAGPQSRKQRKIEQADRDRVGLRVWRLAGANAPAKRHTLSPTRSRSAGKNRMFRDVSSKVSFPELETKVLQFWTKNRIFQKSVDARAEAPLYVFYEGPPTANGLPGIHHVLARVFKDVIPRYRTMK